METPPSSMEAKNLRSTDRESGRIAPLNIPIEYSDLQEHRTSEQQRIWTKTIADGPFKRSPYYKKIAVLTLSFHRDFDDLGDGVQSEIDNLSSLFRESFNYPVENFELRPEEDAQVIINARVAKFVCDNRGPDTLLIVYYAGHGRPGTNHGELVVFNKPRKVSSSQIKDRVWDRTVVWNTTETLLKSATSDVFVIFDCCHAGDLVYKRGPRPFEYLAATGPGQVTGVPGQGSFTSALISSLATLLNEKGCFTSSELADKIDNHPAFPKEQHPVLTDRDEESAQTGRIMLHALPKPGASPNPSEVPGESPTQSAPSTPKLGKVLTLHFHFEGDPTDKEIEVLAKYFNNERMRRTLPIEQIRWGGLRQSAFCQAVERWKAIAHGRSSSSTASLTIPRTDLLVSRDHELAVHGPQSPLTPTSEGSVRDEEAARRCASTKRLRSLSSSGIEDERRTKRRAQNPHES